MMRLKHRSVRQTVAAFVLLVLLVAAPAAADLGDQKSQLDAQIGGLHDKIADARAHEAMLSTDIASVSTQIRTLETQVGAVSNRLVVLDRDLALHRRRLRQIKSLLLLQAKQLHLLRAEYKIAVARLDQRLVDIYKSDQPSVIDVVLGAKSFSDVLDEIDYLNLVANQDKQLATTVGHARRRVHVAQRRTMRAHVSVASEMRVIAYRVDQAAALRDRLLVNRESLSAARASKARDLASTRVKEQEWLSEANSLASVSAQLASQIAAAQSSSANSSSATAGSPASSPSGLIWPVSGPITSPFGMRWGSLHPGLDIGAEMGTPIKAAAAGRVITAGYNGGYGNLVVLDNGGGIATAYAHQSSIAVSVGRNVNQGQVIGYVGSTGFSTGPHLHFEVRVNGSPVDPMGYLG